MTDRITPEAVAEVLEETSRDELTTLADAYPTEHSLDLDVAAVGEVNDRIQRQILSNPDDLQGDFEHAIGETDVVDGRLAKASVRFENLPARQTVSVGGERVRDGHLASLVAFEGQVTKRTEVLPKLEVGVFQCMRCGWETRQPQPAYGTIRRPFQCEGCEQGQFVLHDGMSEWTDYQKVRLQQPPEDAVDGATAHIDVHLEGDLCADPEEGGVACGMRATFIGKYCAVRERDNVVHQKAVTANNFVPEQAAFEDLDTELSGDLLDLAEREDTYEVLLDALAPGHHGYETAKEAVLLSLFAGWSRTGPGGSFHRGNSHVYLIGDPGVGKSVLLEAAADLAPRAALTDGTGSSAAGLTASMVRDDFGESNAWTIQAGTLPLANDGVAVVDELDKGDTDDLDALHTALESQEVRISKAGRQAVLPAETTLLAAGNPTGGHWDPTASFAAQVDLQSPLLSRFDLILVLRQKDDADEIEALAEHITGSRQTAGRLARGEEVDDAAVESASAPVDRDVVTRYIAHARAHYQPLIRDPAVKNELVSWYTDLRTSIDERTGEEGPPLPVTARKLDAAARLCEARARAHLRNTIRMSDVEAVTALIERSLADIGVAPSGSHALGNTTSSEPDATEVGI